MVLPGRPPKSERTRLYDGLAAVVVPAVTAVAKLEISGTENIPSRGSFVLSPNHLSEIDPLVVAVALWKSGRVPRFMAKASLFKLPVIGAILTKGRQIPVERTGRTGGSSMAAARLLVQEELGVVIYPEGSLTRDPGLWPMRGKTGAVRMALEAGVPLIPAAHWGAQEVLPRYGKLLRVVPRKRVRVVFGKPVDLSPWAGRKDQTALTEATEAVMAAISNLLGELRGEQPPVRRWDPKSEGQAETGRFNG